jgi:DNA repair protein RadC
MAIPMTCMPREQRPRERLWALGADALSDAEVLALLLRHGRTGESALDRSS